MNKFELDLKHIRARAREQMKQGSVTTENTSNVPAVIDVLNQALATEVVCVLRYMNHHYVAKGIKGKTVADEFLEHANEEQDHANKLSVRIKELGGEPNLDPVEVAKASHTEYKKGENIRQMLTENLVAERIAISTYTEIIRWIGDHDPTTRRLLEEILAKEEEHADDISDLMADGG